MTGSEITRALRISCMDNITYAALHSSHCLRYIHIAPLNVA
jgi:hypothetical protein